MHLFQCGTRPGSRLVLVIVLAILFSVAGAKAQEVNIHPIIEPPFLIGGKDTVMAHVYTYDLFPAPALDLDIDGDAIVQFTVDTSGSPINVELFQERPEGLGFGDSAVVAVKALRFVVPQTRLPDGSIGKAPVLMQQVVRFRCDEYREYKRTHPNVRQVTRPAPPDPSGAMGWPLPNPEPPPPPQKSDYSTPAMPVQAEEMGIEPQLVGGEEALYEYIRTHNLYPQQACDAAIEGDVLLEYTVTPQGQIVDIKVVQERPSGLGFGDAARKAIEAMSYIPDKRQVKEELYLRVKMIVRFGPENG